MSKDNNTDSAAAQPENNTDGKLFLKTIRRIIEADPSYPVSNPDKLVFELDTVLDVIFDFNNSSFSENNSMMYLSDSVGSAISNASDTRHALRIFEAYSSLSQLIASLYLAKPAIEALSFILNKAAKEL